MAKFVVQGVDYHIPSSIIADSKTISDLIADTGYTDVISFNVDFPNSWLDSMMFHDDQDVLPILDFLNCPNMMVRVGTKIIDRLEPLTELTKRILYSFPRLAYQAYLNGLMVPGELPKYDSSVIISREEWIKFIDNDVDRLIILLNMGVQPSSLLDDIKMMIIKSVDHHHRIVKSPEYKCKCGQRNSIFPANSNVEQPELVEMLYQLIVRLDEVKPEVLESLLITFRYSPILNKMIKLKLIDPIRRIHETNLIPDNYDCTNIVLDMRDDEMVDLMEELKLFNNRPSFLFATDTVLTSDDTICSEHAMQLARYALETGYTYPIKYVNHNSIMQLANRMEYRHVIEASEDVLNCVFSIEQLITHPSVILGIINSGRIELAQRLVDRMSDIHRDRWNDTKRLIPLPIFSTEQEYIGLMGSKPIPTYHSIMGVLTGSQRYGQMIRQMIDQLSQEDRIMIVGMILPLSEYHAITNLEMVEHLLSHVSVDQFVSFSRDKYRSLIEEYGDEDDMVVAVDRKYGDDNIDANIEALYYKVMAQCVMSMRRMNDPQLTVIPVPDMNEPQDIPINARHIVGVAGGNAIINLDFDGDYVVSTRWEEDRATAVSNYENMIARERERLLMIPDKIMVATQANLHPRVTDEDHEAANKITEILDPYRLSVLEIVGLN